METNTLPSASAPRDQSTENAAQSSTSSIGNRSSAGARSTNYGAIYKTQTESSIAHHSPSGSFDSTTTSDFSPITIAKSSATEQSPRSSSFDRYSSRFSADNDSSPRSKSEPRVRKISGNDTDSSLPTSPAPDTPTRKYSSTWPYVSPSMSPSPEGMRSRGSSFSKNSPRSRTSSQSKPRSRSSSRNRSRRGSISDLLDDQGDQFQNISKEEEKELDNVQVNIRRIHRKSITDSVAISKLPHLEKFESVTSSAAAPTAAERKPPIDSKEKRRSIVNAPVDSDDWTDSGGYHSRSHRTRSPGRTRSGSERARSPGQRRSTTDRHRSLSNTHTTTALKSEERPKSPATPKAPSAKIKDKSRSKSPRPKSPPPQLSTTNTDDYFDSLERWKENRWVRLL